MQCFTVPVLLVWSQCTNAEKMWDSKHTGSMLRSFLAKSDCVNVMRQIQEASLQELADMCKTRVMELGFAVATYPASSYIHAEGITDQQARAKQQEANNRLQAALDSFFSLVNLLHLTQDKVLNLSLLNLTTMQPEMPSAGYWQGIANKLNLGPDCGQEVHLCWLWYNSKRSTCIAQMQQTMQQLRTLFATAEQPADSCVGGAEPRTARQPSSAVGRNSSCSGSSGCSVSEVPHLTLEEADAVAQKLGRQVWQLREVSRCLGYQFLNTVDPYQLALVVLHSWPFLAQPAPIIEAIVVKRVQEQADEGQEGLQQELQQVVCPPCEDAADGALSS